MTLLFWEEGWTTETGEMDPELEMQRPGRPQDLLCCWVQLQLFIYNLGAQGRLQALSVKWEAGSRGLPPCQQGPVRVSTQQAMLLVPLLNSCCWFITQGSCLLLAQGGVVSRVWGSHLCQPVFSPRVC